MRSPDAEVLAPLTTAALNAARTFLIVRDERNRLGHLAGDRDTTLLDGAETRYRYQRSILADAARAASRHFDAKGVSLLTAIARLRHGTARALSSSDIPGPVAETIVAEISSAVVLEYYSAAGATLL